MRIEEQPPMPQPDRVVFDSYDLMPLATLCAGCISQFFNAAHPVSVARTGHTGTSADCLGKEIELPSGKTFEWNVGSYIPAGYDYIIEFLMVFGSSAKFSSPSLSTIPMFAVTTVDGTAYCGWCAGVALNKKR